MQQVVEYLSFLLQVLLVTRAPVGITSAIFTLIFSLTTGIIKKITKHNNTQKENTW